MDKISVNFRIDSKAFKQFKHLCLLEGCSMTERIEGLIKSDVEGFQEENSIKLAY